jgi:hypothetical protein
MSDLRRRSFNGEAEGASFLEGVKGSPELMFLHSLGASGRTLASAVGRSRRLAPRDRV